MSFLLDLKVLAKTALSVLKRENIYVAPEKPPERRDPS